MDLTMEEEKVLRAIPEDEAVSVETLANLTQLPEDSILAIIQSLMEKGYLKELI